MRNAQKFFLKLIIHEGHGPIMSINNYKFIKACVCLKLIQWNRDGKLAKKS